MYKIYNIGGAITTGDTWKWDSTPDFAALASQNYGGVYIMCSRLGKDNPQLSALYTAAFSAGLRVGFYIQLEDSNTISYAKQILSLSPWYGGGRKLGLPPAIIFAGSNKTPHVVRGDFATYFKSFLLDVFPNVVIGFNAGSKNKMFDPAGEDITSFKNMMTQDKVRLWYFSYNAAQPSLDVIAPFKSVWIWGKAPHENWIEFESTPVEPTPVDPPVEPPVTPPLATLEIKVALEEIIRQLGIIVSKLG